MKNLLFSSLSALALTACGIPESNTTTVTPIACESPENPTATMSIKTRNGVAALCSYSRLEISPDDIRFNSAGHCTTLRNDSDNSKTDAIVSKSLTKSAQKINPNIISIQALWLLPHPVQMTERNFKQLDGTQVTVYLSDPDYTGTQRSCHKVDWEFIYTWKEWLVVIKPDDYAHMNKISWKKDWLAGASWSIVLDDQGKAVWRFVASLGDTSDILHRIVNSFWKILYISPLYTPDGKINGYDQ